MSTRDAQPDPKPLNPHPINNLRVKIAPLEVLVDQNNRLIERFSDFSIFRTPAPEALVMIWKLLFAYDPKCDEFAVHERPVAE